MPTEDQIKLLVELQKLDTHIFKLKKELFDQPIFIKRLEDEYKLKEENLKKREEELKSLAVRRKERELELESKESGIKKLQTQLYSLKTNQEYQTMQKEIASQRADVSVIEEGIIKVLVQTDECTAAIAHEKEVLVQHKQQFAQEKAKVDARTKEIEADLSKLDSQRAEIAQKADKKLLSQYDRILHAKNGLALVRVIGNACGGCNINLPPQVINEVRLKEELIFCGSCARILYYDESGQ